MFQKMTKFLKQHNRGKWTHEALCAAMRDVEMNKTSERQSTANDVPRQTLRCYLKKLHNSAGVSGSSLGRLVVLRPDQGGRTRRTYHGYGK